MSFLTESSEKVHLFDRCFLSVACVPNIEPGIKKKKMRKVFDSEEYSFRTPVVVQGQTSLQWVLKYIYIFLIKA